ncbi:serine hydrolase [Streptomyces sp. NPDC007971]|uniref:serine hydrolase n=1 Tax=Streptomyces sp. NPDC007971 TaxID=3364799 RepID=UPI0036EAFCD4
MPAATMRGTRFGEVKDYDGAPLPAPKLPETPLKSGEGFTDVRKYGLPISAHQEVDRVGPCPAGGPAGRDIQCRPSSAIRTWPRLNVFWCRTAGRPFTKSQCQPCPDRPRCTSSRESARNVGFPPRELRDLQVRVRSEPQTPEWKARYAVRSGVEGTINEFAHGHGMRRCRYRERLVTAVRQPGRASLRGGETLEWVGSAGVRKLGEAAKPPTNGRFWMGSTTKAFTATLVLQLVAGGKIGLNSPVADYPPGLALDRRITVRMLLQHTSGLFDYAGGERYDDGTFVPGIPAAGQEWVDNRFRPYRPEELVQFALSKPPRFEPGTDQSYANTNYTLALLLIERVTGRSYAAEMQRRILRPLGLRDTIVPDSRTEIPGPHAHGYYRYQDAGQWKVVDVTRQNLSLLAGEEAGLGPADRVDRGPSSLGGHRNHVGPALLISIGLSSARDPLPHAVTRPSPMPCPSTGGAPAGPTPDQKHHLARYRLERHQLGTQNS